MRGTLRFVAVILGLAGLACLGMFVFKGAGAGKLTWEDPVVRKSVMTFGYKVYGDPTAENGRFFLSKIVFRNDGTGPVHDFSVSYQIPDYVPWTTPATQTELPAGQTLVSLYYPQLPSKVTALTNRTNVTLETKVRWADKAGEVKEEILRSPIVFRGVNEIEYCDLPENEVATFYDMHSTAEFSVAMVTPNDPVVKEFVAEVTKRTGGTLAGIEGGKELFNTMKAMYDYMCETGMRYTSSEGVPSKLGDVATTVQTVRMPRDVIITNQGLCIELALLWASAMEYLGCDTDVIFIPGHAFVIVSAGQQTIPVECTAVTPKSVQSWLKELGLSENTPVIPFEKAVQLSQMELENIKRTNEPFTVYNVKAYQDKGMHAPELPEVDIEKIKNILAQRNAHGAAAYAQNVGSANRDAGVPPGYYRWVGANNTASVDVPGTWTRMENTPVPGMVFTAQDMQTTAAVNVFHFPSLSSPVDAMQVARRGVAQASGGTVRIATQQQKGNMIIYTGTTSYRRGTGTEWAGFFAPTPNGVVGLFVGSARGTFERNQPVIQQVISSFKVAGMDGGEQNQ
jgi:hypothetical protein